MQLGQLKRREFISLLSGVAACPLTARAQQSAVPVIGFVSSLKSADITHVMMPFRQGLNDTGRVEGRNVAMEYRWAEGQYDRLPKLVADLITHQVAVIAAISGTPAGLAAKAATNTIPIVFAVGSDPVAQGLVGTLNRPNGNVTGVTFYTAKLGAKRLQLLRAIAPRATTIALVVNPSNPPSALEGTDIEAASRAIGQPIEVFRAGTEAEIDDAFGTIVEHRSGALLLSADPLFLDHREKVVAFAARHKLPAIFADREFAEAGGLISYGGSRTDAYRQAGTYVGRILNGEKPGDLPVLQSTRFELVINLKVSNAAGITIPAPLLVLADEVIE